MHFQRTVALLFFLPKKTPQGRTFFQNIFQLDSCWLLEETEIQSLCICMTQHKKPEQEAGIEFSLLHSLVRNILGKCKKTEKQKKLFVFFVVFLF